MQICHGGGCVGKWVGVCVCVVTMLVCAAGRRIHGYVRDDEWHDGEHGEQRIRHMPLMTCVVLVYKQEIRLLIQLLLMLCACMPKCFHFCICLCVHCHVFEWYSCVCACYRLVLHPVSLSPPLPSSPTAATPQELLKCSNKPEKSEQHLEGWDRHVKMTL